MLERHREDPHEERSMKKFMAVYTGSPQSRQKAAWDKLDEATRQQRQAAGMKAWHDWMTTHKDVIVESGGPLGKTKRVSAEGIADFRNNLTGYVVVKADSHEAAAKLFVNHPHFAIFPGEAVEIMDCPPIPGQS
jgi:hypothetical protein